MRRFLGSFLSAVLWSAVFAAPAEATHYRGGDMWARIEPNGLVHLFVKTRWEKGPEPHPFAGLDIFNNLQQTSTFPGVYLRINRINADGTATLVQAFVASSFFHQVSHAAFANERQFFDDTTIARNTADPNFDERVQEILIPLGSAAPALRHTHQQNLQPGFVYSFEWADCARIEGLINAPGDGTCEFDKPGHFFGLRARVKWDGTANGSPAFNSDIITGVPRGFAFTQNINAIDPDNDTVVYSLSATNRNGPDYGPQAHIQGLTLDQNGFVNIPAGATQSFQDNPHHPDADYTQKFVITDSRGGLSEREYVIDAVGGAFRPPTISQVGSRRIEVGTELRIQVSGSCAPASNCQSVTLRTTGLPAGASFSLSGTPTAPVGTFTWTPALAQVGNYGINFEAISNNASEPDTIASAFATISVFGANRPPVLMEIPNQRVGADPSGVAPFVSETRSFDAFAADDNAGDVLAYSLPVLLNPAGQNVPLSQLGVSLELVTRFGSRTARITVAPDASDVGLWQLRVRVDDGQGASDEHNVFLSIGTMTNRSPVFSQPPQPERFAVEGTPITFNVTAQDPNTGQTVTLSATGLPPGAAFTTATGNPVTRTFSWTPPAGSGGDYVFTLEARDNGSPQIAERYAVTLHVIRPCGDPAPTPRIVNLLPNRGPDSGGTPVQVLGGPFCGSPSVTLGGVPVTVTAVSQTQFQLVTPPAADPSPSSADLSVTAAPSVSAVLESAFLYLESEPPSFTCPDIVTVNAGLAGRAAVPDLLSGIVFSDNVTPEPRILRFQSVPPGALVDPGDHPVVITAFDENGNRSTCTATVHVVDVTPPQVSCPAPLTLEADATGHRAAPDLRGDVIASDNVTPASQLVIEQTPSPGTLLEIRLHSLQFVVTDAAGNSLGCNTQLGIVDTTPPAAPLLDLPAYANLASVGATAFTIAGEPNATVEVTIDDANPLTAPVVVGGTLRPEGSLLLMADLSGLAEGPLTGLAVLRDLFNNVSAPGSDTSVKDTVPPVTTFAGDTAPPRNAAGWNNMLPVTLGFEVSDATSGVASVSNGGPPVSATTGVLSFGGESPEGGSNGSVTATDRAGNSSETFSPRIFIDVTPPLLSFDAPSVAPNPAGWNNTPVAISFATSDNASGVAGVDHASPLVFSGETAGAAQTVSVTDVAGNSASYTSQLVKVDFTPPSLVFGAVTPAPNAAGWNTTSPVTIGFVATDDLSGVAGTSAPSPLTFAANTNGASAGVTVTDQAGNSASFTSPSVRIDTAAPVITVPGPISVQAPTSAGVAVSYSASAADNLASPVAVLCSPASGSTFPVGATAVSCIASDPAGNQASAGFNVAVTLAPVATPDGRMYGAFHIDASKRHHHVLFRVLEKGDKDAGRLEYWVHDPKMCGGRGDEDYDGRDYDGDRDHHYGRPRHCSPTSRFEATSLSSVVFSDDPAFRPGQRRSPKQPSVDTVGFTGKGKWNGKPGYSFEAQATDRGEPGRGRDTFSIVVKDASGAVVASVDDQLDGGNIQSTRLALFQLAWWWWR